MRPTNNRRRVRTRRRKRCPFTTAGWKEIDYKDVQLMRRFVNERGKIVSGQRIGVSAKNQRRLARAIKRAQHLALIPIAPTHRYVTGTVQAETQRPQEAETAQAQPQAEADAQEPDASEQPKEVVSQTEENADDAAADQQIDAESDDEE